MPQSYIAMITILSEAPGGGLHPDHSLPGGGNYPSHPIAPGGGGGHPSHPIAPGGGGGRPSHPWVPPEEINPPVEPPELPPELENQAVILVHMPGQEWVGKAVPVGPDNTLPPEETAPPHPDQSLPGAQPHPSHPIAGSPPPHVSGQPVPPRPTPTKR